MVVLRSILCGTAQRFRVWQAVLRSILCCGAQRKLVNTVLGAAFLDAVGGRGAGEGDFGVVILENYRFSLKLSILERLNSGNFTS